MMLCAWTDVQAITYRWPMGSAADMTGTFGPRNLVPNWFHAGLDIANLGWVSAPFDIRITAIERSAGNDNYIDFVPTESRSDAAYDVTHMRFRHISIPATWVVGQTFTWGTTLTSPLSGPNHLDMKGWSTLYLAYLMGPQGGGSYCSVKFDDIKLEQGLNLAQK